MAFMDKLGSIAKNIGEKTSDALETTKFSAKIALEKNAVKDDLEKIGEFYYNRFANGEEVAAEVLDYCREAKKHYDAIAEFEDEIERIKEEDDQPKKKFCPICGIELEPGTKYCPACGELIDA